MLMTAGYLNFNSQDNNSSVETSLQIESRDDTKLADIGDATLVSSNDVVEETSKNETNNTTTTTADISNNEENISIETSTSNSNDYFTKSKLERDTMYSQIIETYEKVINSSNAMEMQKQTATQEITKVNDIKNKIMICENLIKTKGFENSVVFVNGESVSIIVESSELQQEQVAQIQNIISREMDTKIENIHIANK
jgi:stage III sporulation protein AH